MSPGRQKTALRLQTAYQKGLPEARICATGFARLRAREGTAHYTARDLKRALLLLLLLLFGTAKENNAYVMMI